MRKAGRWCERALFAIVVAGVAGGCASNDLDSSGRAGSTGTMSGQSGTTGAGGSGGATGVGGSTGSPPVCPFQPFTCPQDLCGNGHRDTCTAPEIPPPSCPIRTVEEACDGSDLGGKTCQSFGFGSGTLSCDRCTLDVSGCSACTTNPALLRCGVAPVTTSPVYAAALAATDAAVGVAWVEGPDRARLRFGLLSPALDAVVVTELDDAVVSTVVPFNMYSVMVSIAPLPSGWVVVATVQDQVFLHAVDAAGRHTSRVALGSTGPGTFAELAPLGARPNGGPLLAWRAGRELRTAVIAGDGQATTPPLVTMLADDGAGLRNVAFVNGVFHVMVEDGIDGDRPTLVQISPTGALLGSVEVQGHHLALNPTLVVGASDLRMVYNGWPADQPAQIVAVQNVSPSGALPAPHSVAATVNDGYRFGTGLAVDDDAFVLLSGQRLGAVRVAADGSIVTPPFEIATSESAAPLPLPLVRRGADVIAGWLDPAPGRLHLARITP